MRKDTPLERLYNGIIKENPTFVMMLGMCPTLAVTTSAKNGIGMGLATMVILTASNLMISLLRKIIPDGVRMPAYIVVVASFVTIVEFLMEGFIPALNKNAIFKVKSISAEGEFATIKTTRQTGGYDIRSFKVHLVPATTIPELKAGMSVLFKLQESSK